MLLNTAISNYLKYMEFVKSASPLTLKAYRRDLEQAFGPCKNDMVTEQGAQSQLLGLTRKAQISWAHLAPASRNRKAATLKSFFAYLFAENITAKNLGLLVQAPKVPKRIPHFISVDEVMSVLKTFEDTTEDAREKTLFLILYGGGLRVSEACSLKWSDYSPETRALRIKGKGGKERVVILPVGINLRLQALLEHPKNGDFFWGAQALNTRTAYEMIRTRGAKAGLLKPLHPHALRHSFATHLLSSGANLRTLQELLGHESLRATEKYTHLGVDQLARTLEAHHPLGNKSRSSKK